MRKWLLIAGIVIIAGFCVLVAVAAPQWPFREGNFKKRIEAGTDSKVEFGSFDQSFLFHPGCVAENVTLTPKDPSRPTVKIKRLAVTGLYSGLIGSQKHLRFLFIDGLQVSFPAKKENAEELPKSHSLPSGFRLDEIDAHNSEVVFATKGEPLKFDIHDLVLKDFAANKPLHFNAKLRLPEPQGDLQISGVFGPLAGQLGQAELSGSFVLTDADLSTFSSVAGKLRASGGFKGKLESLDVEGDTDTPDFTVTEAGHPMHLQTRYVVQVNGTNGDIKFQPIKAQLADTSMVADGALQEQGGKTKQLVLNITSEQARIQDLLYLFMKSKSPLVGDTQFKAKVELPFDSREFLQRVVLDAQFGIHGSKFTAPETAQKVGELSESARGNPKDDDPPTVLTDLLGDVKLVNGSAHFSELHFRAPGVLAAMHGKYNLENEAVDLHGTMRTDVKLSQATTGFKAFMMKIIEFAKSKKKEGATVPVSITGTYEKPSFSIDAPSEK